MFVTAIDQTHQKVHYGKMFTCCYVEYSAANTYNMDLSFSTGAKEAHITIDYNSEGKSYFKTYSGSTYTAAGTLPDGIKLSVFNRNGESHVTATATVRYAPAGITLGTLRGNQILNGGTGGNSTGSKGGTRYESIIPPNSNLLIRQTNFAGVAKDMSMQIDWYEEDD